MRMVSHGLTPLELEAVLDVCDIAYARSNIPNDREWNKDFYAVHMANPGFTCIRELVDGELQGYSMSVDLFDSDSLENYNRLAFCRWFAKDWGIDPRDVAYGFDSATRVPGKGLGRALIQERLRLAGKPVAAFRTKSDAVKSAYLEHGEIVIDYPDESQYPGSRVYIVRLDPDFLNNT